MGNKSHAFIYIRADISSDGLVGEQDCLERKLGDVIVKAMFSLKRETRTDDTGQRVPVETPCDSCLEMHQPDQPSAADLCRCCRIENKLVDMRCDQGSRVVIFMDLVEDLFKPWNPDTDDQFFRIAAPTETLQLIKNALDSCGHRCSMGKLCPLRQVISDLPEQLAKVMTDWGNNFVPVRLKNETESGYVESCDLDMTSAIIFVELLSCF